MTIASTEFEVVIVGLISVVALLTLVWVASLSRRDVSIVDVFWGPGFVLLAWLYWWFAGRAVSFRPLLVPILVSLWGLRLAVHIAWRARGKGEDPRYKAMRTARGGSFAWVSLFTVFWLQAVLMWLVAMPLFQVQRVREPSSVTALDLLGLSLFAVGLLFEAGGDLQLARFKSNPAHQGKVMDRGLWRYTRHPNYFGDAMIWWGLSCIALSTPGSIWILFGTALMTFLLLRVSGVTLLEKGLKETKPEYEDYVRRTSSFFPWPPRR